MNVAKKQQLQHLHLRPNEVNVNYRSLSKEQQDGAAQLKRDRCGIDTRMKASGFFYSPSKLIYEVTYQTDVNAVQVKHQDVHPCAL